MKHYTFLLNGFGHVVDAECQEMLDSHEAADFEIDDWKRGAVMPFDELMFYLSGYSIEGVVPAMTFDLIIPTPVYEIPAR